MDYKVGEILIETETQETEAQRLGRMMRYLRYCLGMKREDFANEFNIPLGTVRDWEQGKRKMPEYLYELIYFRATHDDTLHFEEDRDDGSTKRDRKDSSSNS